MTAPMRGEIPPQSSASNDDQTIPRDGETEPETAAHLLTDQTRYVSVKKIIMVRLAFNTLVCPADVGVQVFLTCSSVDLIALMDQTTLAASLNIISQALDAGSQKPWIAGAYFL